MGNLPIIPPLEFETLRRYQAFLRSKGVLDRQMPHFVKWVRYFVDYAARYGDGAAHATMLDGFSKKLASKGQSAGLQAQARRAVELFLELGGIEEKPSSAKEAAVAVAEFPENFRPPV